MGILDTVDFTDAHIFKYRSLKSGQQIIENQQLMFSKPSTFNDPFDCDVARLRFNFSDAHPIVHEELKQLGEKLVAEQGNTQLARRAYQEITEDHGLMEQAYRHAQEKKIAASSVCCFSRVHDNPVMWSHYADSHKGACLVFRLQQDPFVHHLDGRFTEGPILYGDDKPVNYLADKIEGIGRLFLAKSEQWEYENEYRLVIVNESGLFKFKKKFMEGVIFGIRTRPEECGHVRAMAENSGLGHLKYWKFEKDGLRMRLDRY